MGDADGAAAGETRPEMEHTDPMSPPTSPHGGILGARTHRTRWNRDFAPRMSDVGAGVTSGRGPRRIQPRVSYEVGASRDRSDTPISRNAVFVVPRYSRVERSKTQVWSPVEASV